MSSGTASPFPFPSCCSHPIPSAWWFGFVRHPTLKPGVQQPYTPAMYAAPYGFPNAVPGSGGGAGPTFNGGAPQQQNLHMQQPGPSPNQPQMMYTNQQFPMTAQGHFSGANPAAMMAAAGPAAMMQNPGMPQMAPNGQSKLLCCPLLLLCSHPYLSSALSVSPSSSLFYLSLFGFVCPRFACRVSDGTTRSTWQTARFWVALRPRYQAHLSR